MCVYVCVASAIANRISISASLPLPCLAIPARGSSSTLARSVLGSPGARCPYSFTRFYPCLCHAQTLCLAQPVRCSASPALGRFAALPLCRMTATPLRRSVASYCVWLLPRFVALALGSSGAGRSSALDLFYLHISLPFSGPRCLIIVPLFLLDLVTSCLPLLGGYGALTRGVYQHLTLNGKLKTTTKTIFYRQLSMPCVILPRCRQCRCCPSVDNA